jgi:branched-chain amino acid transport system substrate-binding protein
MKAAIEKAGKVDRKAVAAAMKGLVLDAKKHPGVLLSGSFDDKGDVDRESYLVQVKNGRQEVIAVLPPLSAKK